MTLRQTAIAYALAALAFLALDALWLTLMNERFYRPSIGHLMAEQVDWPAAALFYPLYLGGILGFAVLPALQHGQPIQAALRGAGLGLLAYATYDLTNQATLKDWPWSVTIADLCWGTFATGVAAWVSAAGTARARSR